MDRSTMEHSRDEMNTNELKNASFPSNKGDLVSNSDKKSIDNDKVSDGYPYSALDRVSSTESLRRFDMDTVLSKDYDENATEEVTGECYEGERLSDVSYFSFSPQSGPNDDKGDAKKVVIKKRSDIWDVIDSKIDNVSVKSSKIHHGQLSYIQECARRQRVPVYDYLCRTRNTPPRQVVAELLPPVDDENRFDVYKTEMDFLRKNFSDILPRILYHAVKKRVKDPVHYIVHYLIKYKVDKSMNVPIDDCWL